MKIPGKFPDHWFGYTRRERRATYILINIIIVVMVIRYAVPSREISIEKMAFDLPSDEKIQDTIKRPVMDRKAPVVIHSIRSRPLTDLNKCDSASLEALPGIGPVLSSRIVRYRDLIGGFRAVSQLKEVYGLPEETYNLISGMVFADSLDIRKVKINEATYKDLIRHPYFKKNEVSAILKFRQLSGRISGPEEILKNKLVSEETYKKIRAYLVY